MDIGFAQREKPGYFFRGQIKHREISNLSESMRRTYVADLFKMLLQIHEIYFCFIGL